jgi:hypothetical protein
MRWAPPSSECETDARAESRSQRRKVPRPSCEPLTEDVRAMSFLAVGRKHRASDNAVSRRIRWYERKLLGGSR